MKKFFEKVKGKYQEHKTDEKFKKAGRGQRLGDATQERDGSLVDFWRKVDFRLKLYNFISE